ncbi:hypothetical protein BG011_000978 [Mortierella polycephala]|uniref:Uncharacterized protein n=1 Tax=Mortierella polycephala TaxID=41804 RepID=A0A9P6U6A4_9FUNG|nr:hypothetical protein BG011_000978 [Mortierella polycephala]
MQSSSTISSTAPPAPSAPRAQRYNNNKKSGITTAIHNQSQSTNHNQPRHGNNNNNRQSQRGNNSHSRHQSMPSQQRSAPNGLASSNNKVDMTNVTILKRSSAMPVSKTDGETALSTQLQQHQHQHQHQQHQHQHQYQQRNQKPRPQSQQQPSKARRVQRRREVDAVTESLAHADLDMALAQSPPMNPSSPPSSSDSDDSESTPSRSSNHFLGSKSYRHMSNSPPQRPSSAPVTTSQPLNGGYAHSNRAAHPMETMQRPSVGANKFNSADKVLLADRAPAEKKNGLYAGPTFHNSPAPTSLPIPAFARSLGNSPVEPSVEKSPMPFFGEAASPQLNSMRPLAQPSPVPMSQSMPMPMPMYSAAPGWHGHYSMPMGMSYNVPERMATSSVMPHQTGMHGTDQLMEISHNLRTLLKIQSQ